MIADYGSNEKFQISIGMSLGAPTVLFKGTEKTEIRRNFGFDGKDFYVTHAIFIAAKTGTGASKSLFRSSLGVYHALGVKSIKLKANIDVGGYAWARYGFVPSPWQTIRRALIKKLEKIQAGGYFEKGNKTRGTQRRSIEPVSGDAEMLIKNLLQSKDPKAIWQIADMKIGDRNIGKDLLMNSLWYGSMDLKDSESMARCRAYIGRKS